MQNQEVKDTDLYSIQYIVLHIFSLAALLNFAYLTVVVTGRDDNHMANPEFFSLLCSRLYIIL